MRPSTRKTACGVDPKVVKEYGICDVACSPRKKSACAFVKKVGK
jgi:hypothetical protein